jgi:hypothetical protein
LDIQKSGTRCHQWRTREFAEFLRDHGGVR